MVFVEPPIAKSAIIAFLKLSFVIISKGFLSAFTNSTICMPDSNANLLYDNEATIRNTMDDISTSTWNAIQLGMKRVVEGKVYFKELDVTAAGKTGTAQESKSRANHALFVCFAPYEKPEVAIATRIAFGYSSDYAAQTTKDVLAFYYGKDDNEDIVTGTASDIETGTVSGD